MSPDSHWWGYYPGTLSSSQATATHLKIGHLKISFIGAWSSNDLSRLPLKIQGTMTLVPMMATRVTYPIVAMATDDLPSPPSLRSRRRLFLGRRGLRSRRRRSCVTSDSLPSSTCSLSLLERRLLVRRRRGGRRSRGGATLPSISSHKVTSLPSARSRSRRRRRIGTYQSEFIWLLSTSDISPSVGQLALLFPGLLQGLNYPSDQLPGVLPLRQVDFVNIIF